MAWWRKRNDLPARAPHQDPSDLAELQRAISRLLLTEQGRGRLCSLEVLNRGAMTYFFAYPDDFVQSVQEHDADGQLAPRSIRRTFHIVFAYSAEEGTLELFAKVPGKLKPKLEELFARHILKADLNAWQAPPAFVLTALRSRSLHLPINPVDAVSVTIRRLQFEIPNEERKIELEANPDAGPEDIGQMIEEYLNHEQLRIEELIVRSATLVFEFAPLGDRRPGSATIHIHTPRTCTLRHHAPERVAIILKYLQQWGIDVRRSRPAASAATQQPGTAALA